MGFRNFLGNDFFSGGPPPVGNGVLVGVWPILGLGHLEKFQAQAKNRKTQFLGARGPKIEEKKLPRYPGWLSATFLHVYVLPDRTPSGGKSQNTEIVAHFGLWHLEKSRARAENRKPQFPGARGPKIKEKKLPRYSG